MKFKPLIDIGFEWERQDKPTNVLIKKANTNKSRKNNNQTNRQTNTLHFFKRPTSQKETVYILGSSLSLEYIFQNEEDFIEEKRAILKKNDLETYMKDKIQKQLVSLGEM